MWVNPGLSQRPKLEVSGLTQKHLGHVPRAGVPFTQECLSKGQKDFPLAQFTIKLQNIKLHLI